MSRIEFWFEFASTYSYLSAMRIEEMAREAGCEITWKPFLLGPAFKAQGWETSPFNLYPMKGKYMVRDIERIAKMRDLSFRLPDPFPQNGLHAARLTLVGIEEGWGPFFARTLYKAQFSEGKDISERSTLLTALAISGTDPEHALLRSEMPEIKAKLRANTEESQIKSIFGAPTFITEDGELFWGDDRLEQAFHWAGSR